MHHTGNIIHALGCGMDIKQYKQTTKQKKNRKKTGKKKKTEKTGKKRKTEKNRKKTGKNRGKTGKKEDRRHCRHARARHGFGAALLQDLCCCPRAHTTAGPLTCYTHTHTHTHTHTRTCIHICFVRTPLLVL